ncbi:MAG: BrnT family toxin [Holosporales bacterium]|jgi:uncharacterized DUF497 family protein
MIRFEWDKQKNLDNTAKHGTSFYLAQHAFLDPKRVFLYDTKHSEQENRWFCIGQVDGNILTVRFTLREGIVRIIGAGEWRKGKKIYETQNRQ